LPLKIERYLPGRGKKSGDVEFDDKRLLTTGDTANRSILSLRPPDWEVRFDMNKAQAAATSGGRFRRETGHRLSFRAEDLPVRHLSQAHGSHAKLGQYRAFLLFPSCHRRVTSPRQLP